MVNRYNLRMVILYCGERNLELNMVCNLFLHIIHLYRHQFFGNIAMMNLNNHRYSRIHKLNNMIKYLLLNNQLYIDRLIEYKLYLLKIQQHQKPNMNRKYLDL